MSKVCNHLGCKRKVPKFVLNNPKGEPLCAVHHGLQVRMEETRTKCTIIGCDNMAWSSGLCKNHSHVPYSPRMDLLGGHTADRQVRLKQVLTDVLKHKKPLDLLQPNDFRCLYCQGEAHTSIGPSPAHCCPVCWEKIQKC